MKTKFILLLLFISSAINAQERSITLKSGLSFESISFNGNSIEDIFSGYLDNNLKNNILNLNDQHTINFDFTSSLKYTEKIRNNLFYNFSFSDITQLNAKFDNDLLKLALKGNYDYQDETLNFDNTRIRATRYQQFKLHLENSADKYSIGLGISYVHGNHNYTIISNSASIYTAPMGLYLDLNYDINAYATDTVDFSLFENNGNGVALDLTGSYSAFNHKLEVYMHDLGFIMWSNNSNNILVDSSYIFNGVTIDNIFDFNDSILEASNIVDDYDNLSEKNSQYKSYLSSNIGFKISKQVRGNRFGLITYGMNTRWQPYIDNEKLSFNKIKQGFEESDYKPYYYVKTEIKFNKISILPKIGYGGYTNNLNVDMALMLKKKISFAIGTQHLEFLFDKANTYGAGIYLQIFKEL